MKRLIVTATIVLFSIAEINAQNSLADIAWGRLESLRPEITSDNELVREVSSEMYKRDFLEEGVKFWNNFGTDPRRYKWLRKQLSQQPAFWLSKEKGAKESKQSQYYNTQVDINQFGRWDSIKTLFIASAVSDTVNLKTDERLAYSWVELYSVLMHSRNYAYRKAYPDYLTRIKQLLSSAINGMDKFPSENALQRSTEILFLATDNFNLSLDELEGIVKPYINSGIPEVKKWAEQRMKLLELRNAPLDLLMKDHLGNSIKMNQLRGKVFLLDFWNTSCSICIGRMPALKEIYDKYKDSGFEIVSACTDSEDKYRKVKEIKNRIGSTWPTVMLGEANEETAKKADSQVKRIINGYGFMSVPQLLLFDKKGKLVMLNGSLQTKDFSDVIENLLKENTNEGSNKL